MPLPLTVSCFSKIQTGLTFLVAAYLGSPGKRAVVCVTTQYNSYTTLKSATRKTASTKEGEAGHITTLANLTVIHTRDRGTFIRENRRLTAGQSSMKAAAYTIIGLSRKKVVALHSQRNGSKSRTREKCG